MKLFFSFTNKNIKPEVLCVFLYKYAIVTFADLLCSVLQQLTTSLHETQRFEVLPIKTNIEEI